MNSKTDTFEEWAAGGFGGDEDVDTMVQALEAPEPAVQSAISVIAALSARIRGDATEDEVLEAISECTEAIRTLKVRRGEWCAECRRRWETQIPTIAHDPRIKEDDSTLRQERWVVERYGLVDSSNPCFVGNSHAAALVAEGYAFTRLRDALKMENVKNALELLHNDDPLMTPAAFRRVIRDAMGEPHRAELTPQKALSRMEHYISFLDTMLPRLPHWFVSEGAASDMMQLLRQQQEALAKTTRRLQELMVAAESEPPGDMPRAPELPTPRESSGALLDMLQKPTYEDETTEFAWQQWCDLCVAAGGKSGHAMMTVGEAFEDLLKSYGAPIVKAAVMETHVRFLGRDLAIAAPRLTAPYNYVRAICTHLTAPPTARRGVTNVTRPRQDCYTPDSPEGKAIRKGLGIDD